MVCHILQYRSQLFGLISCFEYSFYRNHIFQHDDILSLITQKDKASHIATDNEIPWFLHKNTPCILVDLHIVHPM